MNDQISPRPDRGSMKADAAAALQWLRSNETWMLLDQTVTPLLGRSLTRIVFELCSAVIELPDEVLEDLVVLAASRCEAYADGAGTAPIDDRDLAALAAFRAAVASAVVGTPLV